MPSHPWISDVVGGVGPPRILEVNDNWITDIYFQEGLGNWSQSQGGILTRVITTSAYLEYMGNISYSSDHEYVYMTYNYGSSITDKIFMFTFRVQSDQQFGVSFWGSTGFGVTIFAASANVSKKTVVVAATGQTGNSIQVRISGTIGTGNANLYFDSAYFTEVLNDYTLPQPNESFIKFKSDFVVNELWDGSSQNIGDKRLPIFYAKWDYFSDTYELNRQSISEAERLFCIPHDDANFGFLGVWNKKFFRGYALDRFFGHMAVITIAGEGYLLAQPTEVVAPAVDDIWYIEDDIIWDL